MHQLQLLNKTKKKYSFIIAHRSFAPIVMLIGLIMYVISDAATKCYLEKFTASEVTFVRAVARIIPFSIIALINFQNPYKSVMPRIQILRALLACVLTYLFMLANQGSSLTEVYTIGYLSPIFIVLFSYLFLKERITKVILFSVLIGFLGIFITFNPKFGKISDGAIFALLGAILAALNQVIMKKILNKDSNLSIIMYHNTVLLVITSILCKDLTVLFANFPIKLFITYAILTSIGQYCIAYAIQNAQTSKLAILNYSTIVPIYLIDYCIWRYSPDMKIILGLLLVIISNIIIIFYQKKSPNEVSK